MYTKITTCKHNAERRQGQQSCRGAVEVPTPLRPTSHATAGRHTAHHHHHTQPTHPPCYTPRRGAPTCGRGMRLGGGLTPLTTAPPPAPRCPTPGSAASAVAPDTPNVEAAARCVLAYTPAAVDDPSMVRFSATGWAPRTATPPNDTSHTPSSAPARLIFGGCSTCVRVPDARATASPAPAPTPSPPAPACPSPARRDGTSGCTVRRSRPPPPPPPNRPSSSSSSMSSVGEAPRAAAAVAGAVWRRPPTPVMAAVSSATNALRGVDLAGVRADTPSPPPPSPSPSVHSLLSLAADASSSLTASR